MTPSQGGVKQANIDENEAAQAISGKLAMQIAQVF